MSTNPSTPASPVPRASLPGAAQRWLAEALPPEIPLPAQIRIEQAGAMDIRGRWTAFRASGVYTAAPLAFHWRARFSILPGLWLVAEDGHRAGQGWGGARLWGKLSLGQRTGPVVLAVQLVRNLGELPWFPSFILTDPGLTWADAGHNACEVRSQAGDREVRVRFDIDEHGAVVRAHSPARPYDVPGGYAEAPWSYEFSDHRDFNGVRIPAIAAARFEKSDGVWEYFRCRLTSVVFGTA